MGYLTIVSWLILERQCQFSQLRHLQLPPELICKQQMVQQYPAQVQEIFLYVLGPGAVPGYIN